MKGVFNFAAGVSLLLCVAAAVLWAASYHRGRLVRWAKAEPTDQAATLLLRTRSLAMSRGHAVVDWTSAMVRYVDAPHAAAELARVREQRATVQDFAPANPNFNTYNVTNFYVGRYVWRFQQGTLFERGVVVPFWALTLATGVLPALWMLAWRGRRRVRLRRAAGLCLRCGYDLRESPGRCPECGTDVTV